MIFTRIPHSVHIFTKNGVDFISMTESFDTSTPFGKAMIGILSVFSQLEREQIKERMQMGLEARAKEGYYHGGPYAPIGYEYIDGELVINEYEAYQIQKIFELAEEKMPIYSVYKYMKSKGYRHKYGEWTATSVRDALTSIVHSGRIQWKGEVYPGRHTPIITPERFDKMAAYLENRDLGHFRKHPFTRTSLLGGIIFCGHCGARYYCKQIGKQKYYKNTGKPRSHKYYICYSRGKTTKSMIKDPNCMNPIYNVNKLNQIIIDEITKLAMDKEYFKSIVEPSNKQMHPRRKDILKNRLKDIDGQVSKLIDLYQIGGIDISSITEKINNLNLEKETLKTELVQDTSTNPAISVENARIILDSFPEILASSDEEAIKNIIHSLIDGILIYEDEIKVHWRFT